MSDFEAWVLKSMEPVPHFVFEPALTAAEPVSMVVLQVQEQERASLVPEPVNVLQVKAQVLVLTAQELPVLILIAETCHCFLLSF